MVTGLNGMTLTIALDAHKALEEFRIEAELAQILHQLMRVKPAHQVNQ